MVAERSAAAAQQLGLFGMLLTPTPAPACARADPDPQARRPPLPLTLIVSCNPHTSDTYNLLYVPLATLTCFCAPPAAPTTCQVAAAANDEASTWGPSGDLGAGAASGSQAPAPAARETAGTAADLARCYYTMQHPALANTRYSKALEVRWRGVLSVMDPCCRWSGRANAAAAYCRVQPPCP